MTEREEEMERIFKPGPAVSVPPDIEYSMKKGNPEKSALDTQVGGAHYKGMKIQPVEFIHANDLGFIEGCIIKRICRWRSKNGIEDLRKITHECLLLIELEERNAKSS